MPTPSSDELDRMEREMQDRADELLSIIDDAQTELTHLKYEADELGLELDT